MNQEPRSEPQHLAPTVVLREIRIRDFRGIEDLWLPLDETTLLLGENNVGKTSVLEAIGIALGLRGSPDDLRIGQNEERADYFVIDARLEPAVGLEFDDAVVALATSAIRIPEDSSEAQYLALRVIGRHNRLQGRIDDSRSFLDRWQRHADDEPDPKVLDRPLMPRELREGLLFQLIDARRDVAEQLRMRSSFWGRLVGDLDLDETLAASVFSELSEIGERIVSGSPVLSSVKAELQRSVDTLAPTAGTVGLKPLPGVTDNLARSMDVVVSASDSPEISLSQQGMGARSLAVLMIFQAFAQKRLNAREGAPTLSLTAFEEPEAHLHPHASRAVFPLISSVPGQKVVSTHSTHVASAMALKRFRVLRRTGSRVTAHWASQPALEEIASRASVSKLVVRRQSDILFARVIAVVEGETEERIARLLFAAVCDGSIPEELGITIVDAEGAQGVTAFALMAESFGGPWLTLLDGDGEGKDAMKNIAKALGRPIGTESDEIVMLSDGQVIEQYIIENYKPVLLRGISSHYGEDVLDEYRDQLHGKKARGGRTRDYESEGGEERLLEDFLKDKKPGWGEAFAHACLEEEPVLVPERFDALLQRAKTLARKSS